MLAVLRPAYINTIILSEYTRDKEYMTHRTISTGQLYPPFEQATRFKRIIQHFYVHYSESTY